MWTQSKISNRLLRRQIGNILLSAGAALIVFGALYALSYPLELGLPWRMQRIFRVYKVGELTALAVAGAAFWSALRFLRTQTAVELRNVGGKFSPAERRYPVLVMLAVCFAIALAGALIYVLSGELGSALRAHRHVSNIYVLIYLLAGELAHRNPLADWGFDMLVAPDAAARAVVVFPFFYFMLRERPLRQSVWIVLAAVLIDLAIVTPMDAETALAGSYVAFAIGVLVARQWTRHAATPNMGWTFRQDKRPITWCVLLALIVAALLITAHCAVAMGQNRAERYVRAKWGSAVDDGDAPGALAVTGDRDHYLLPYATAGLAIDLAALVLIIAMFARRRFYPFNAAVLSVWLYVAGSDGFAWCLARFFAGGG